MAVSQKMKHRSLCRQYLRAENDFLRINLEACCQRLRPTIQQIDLGYSLAQALTHTPGQSGGWIRWLKHLLSCGL